MKLHFPYSTDQLLSLMQQDPDGFNRWEACQQLGVQQLQSAVAAFLRGQAMQLDQRLIDAFASLLEDESLDQAMVAHMLVLPTEAYLTELADVVEVEAIHAAREFARRTIAAALKDLLLQVYHRSQRTGSYEPSADQIAQRSLRNVCLSYLMLLDAPESLELCNQQFQQADNMTDQMAALGALVNCESAAAALLKQQALDEFYARWQHEPLVVNQWFQVQATARLPGTLETVLNLMQHPAFEFKNPNKLRAVIGAFCGQNAINFHQADGAAYAFLADQVIALDKSNPQIGARLVTPLTKWKKYPPARQEKMKAQLSRIIAQGDLSKDIYEVVSKSLK